MKIRFVSMPHEIQQQGDACWYESGVPGPHGCLWLYIWLPGEFHYSALRVFPGKFEQQGIGPLVYSWDGDRNAPTLQEALPCDCASYLVKGRFE